MHCISFFIMEKTETHFISGPLCPAVSTWFSDFSQTSSFHELLWRDGQELTSLVTESPNALTGRSEPLSSKAKPLSRHHWVMREADCGAALCRVLCWWLESVPCSSSGAVLLILLILEADLETSGDILAASLSPETRLPRFQNSKIQFSQSFRNSCHSISQRLFMICPSHSSSLILASLETVLAYAWWCFSLPGVPAISPQCLPSFKVRISAKVNILTE